MFGTICLYWMWERYSMMTVSSKPSIYMVEEA